MLTEKGTDRKVGFIMDYYVSSQEGFPIKYSETVTGCIEYLVQACVKNGNHEYLRKFKIVRAFDGKTMFDFS